MRSVVGSKVDSTVRGASKGSWFVHIPIQRADYGGRHRRQGVFHILASDRPREVPHLVEPCVPRIQGSGIRGQRSSKWIPILVVTLIELQTDSNLTEVVQANHLPRPIPRSSQRRHGEGSQDPNDHKNHQQLHQSESASPRWIFRETHKPRRQDRGKFVTLSERENSKTGRTPVAVPRKSAALFPAIRTPHTFSCTHNFRSQRYEGTSLMVSVLWRHLGRVPHFSGSDWCKSASNCESNSGFEAAWQDQMARRAVHEHNHFRSRLSNLATRSSFAPLCGQPATLPPTRAQRHRVPA